MTPLPKPRRAPSRLTDVKERLHRLAQSQSTKPAQPAGRGFLSQLLTEIDECVLPRVLELHVNGQLVAEVHAGHRALLSLQSRTGVQSPPEHATLADFARTLIDLAMECAHHPYYITRRAERCALRPVRCSASDIRRTLAQLNAQDLHALRDHAAERAVSARMVLTGSAHTTSTGDKAFWPSLEIAQRMLASDGTDSSRVQPPPASQDARRPAGLMLLSLTTQHTLALFWSDEGCAAYALLHDSALALRNSWAQRHLPDGLFDTA